MRLRFLGTNAHTLVIANVFRQDVKPGDVFEVPDKWAYALKKRGTPVERVSDVVETSDASVADEPLADEVVATVEKPEPDAAPEGDAPRRRGRRKPEPDAAPEGE